MRYGSLCSGIGGLDLAVEQVFGCRLAWHSEYAAEPASIHERHWPGVPNLGDLTVIDWASLEPVELICAGYPCQPFSHAGARRGETDERHLWPYINQAVRVLRPRWVVLENVAGHLSLGFGTVLADLDEIGYDAEWCCVRASDVGAPHGRLRLFVLAKDRYGSLLHGWDDRRRRLYHDQPGEQGPLILDTGGCRDVSESAPFAGAYAEPVRRHDCSTSTIDRPVVRSASMDRERETGGCDVGSGFTVPAAEGPPSGHCFEPPRPDNGSGEVPHRETFNMDRRVDGLCDTGEGRDRAAECEGTGAAAACCPGCVDRVLEWQQLGDTTADPRRRSGAVLGDLAEAGYDTEWCSVRASDVGAPHGRLRLFVVAADTSSGDAERRRGPGIVAGQGRAPEGEARERERGRDTAGDSRQDAPDTDRPGLGRLKGSPSGRDTIRPHVGRDTDGCGELTADSDSLRPLPSGQPRRGWPGPADGSLTPADTDLEGLEGRRTMQERGDERTARPGCLVDWGPYEPAIRRWEHLTRPAPRPTDDKGRLSADFVEFLMGYPEGWTAGLTRSKRLKALGNAVVPQQGTFALSVLKRAWGFGERKEKESA